MSVFILGGNKTNPLSATGSVNCFSCTWRYYVYSTVKKKKSKRINNLCSTNASTPQTFYPESLNSFETIMTASYWGLQTRCFVWCVGSETRLIAFTEDYRHLLISYMHLPPFIGYPANKVSALRPQNALSIISSRTRQLFSGSCLWYSETASSRHSSRNVQMKLEVKLFFLTPFLCALELECITDCHFVTFLLHT